MSSPRKFTWAPPTTGRGPARPKAQQSSTSISGAAVSSRKRPRVDKDSGQQPAEKEATETFYSSVASSATLIPPNPDSQEVAPKLPVKTALRGRGSRVGGRFQVTRSTHHPMHGFNEYKDFVERHGGIYQIDPRTWVAEIYDGGEDGEENRRWGVDAWTVIRSNVLITGAVSYSCAPCPDFAHFKTCSHVLLLEGPDCPQFIPYWDEDDPECTCYEHRRVSADGGMGTMFVLLGGVTKPVMVSHYEPTNTWTCSKDGTVSCAHIALAKINPGFQEVLKSMKDDEVGGESSNEEALSRAEAERKQADRNSLKELYDERSISWLPVGPPMWCRLEEDKAPSYSPIAQIPSLLRLGKDARCRFGHAAEEHGPVNIERATIFGLTKATVVNIEVQRCKECPPIKRQFAGPDLRELGIFNYNNSRLYTHELLNHFTTSSAVHETPFHSFCTLIERSYIEAGSSVSFVHDDAFRTAYFSFSRVQDFGESFQCSKCGPNPRVVIFDGVTAGFRNKHQTSTLCPPTLIMPNAPVRENVRPPVRATSLVSGNIRIQAQKAVRWRMEVRGGKSRVTGIGVEGGGSDSDEEAADADVDFIRASKQTIKRISKRDALDQAMREGLPKITRDLAAINKSISKMFGRFVNSEYSEAQEGDKKPYLELLEHVFAAESALLFVPQTTWLALSMLTKDDHTAAATLLRDAPAIGAVARMELQRTGAYSDDLKGVVKFILYRAIDVLSTLPQHDYEPAVQVASDVDWRETGVFYGRPRVRLRPQYPNLPADQKVDRAVVSEGTAGGIGCNKFYETYGKRGQTGGLMAAWCPHSVCLGFHCIPKGEGRNDVFSALYMRWEVPPEVVIYDFACALGPYCMLREPKFFGRTRFLIDSFHAKGHTRCTNACFITTYKKNTPALTDLNSSAAECGNGGLLKIRLSLSYMSQRHAIIYAHNYLVMWNRSRRVALIQKEKKAAAAAAAKVA